STSFQFEAKEAGSVIVKIETSAGVAATPQEIVAYIAEGEGAAMKMTKVDGPTPMAVGKGVYRLLIYKEQGSDVAAGLARVTFADEKATIIPPAK
ncbi:MAG: hypothetical protein IT462_05470, partial [Planctomycetes bacterium]|nr:hypothetical protein [Planctomycetota bacterium]